MSDKTAVINPPVPESGNPPGAGESQKEIENRVRENLRAEYERKGQEVNEKLEAMASEKAELESRVNELGAAEQRRLEALTDDKKIAEIQLHELETKPEFAGYREKISRDTQKAKLEAVNDSTHETSKILMAEFLERKAEEEKISVKQLRDELNAVLKIPGSDMIRYPNLKPHERIKEAFRDRSERKRVQTLEDENKRLKAEKDGFSEDGSRQPKDSRNLAQLRDSHISGDKNAGISLSSDLDARQREADSQRK